MILANYKKDYILETENLELFYNDNLESKAIVLNSSGEVTNEFDYSDWGEVEQIVGSEIELALFTGKQYDDTGLIYFNARYYDPTVGRFISEDPSRDEFGWYNYCNNNPINGIDPTGKLPLSDSIDKEYAQNNWMSLDEGKTCNISVEIKNDPNPLRPISVPNWLASIDDKISRVMGTLQGKGPNDWISTFRGDIIHMTENRYSERMSYNTLHGVDLIIKGVFFAKGIHDLSKRPTGLLNKAHDYLANNIKMGTYSTPLDKEMARSAYKFSSKITPDGFPYLSAKEAGAYLRSTYPNHPHLEELTTWLNNAERGVLTTGGTGARNAFSPDTGLSYVQGALRNLTGAKGIPPEIQLYSTGTFALEHFLSASVRYNALLNTLIR